ncbi:sensor histidine kinase [Duganella sp. FT92W]|uniref:histidine kinase n=1 Tax=Pseudoduganella rivuli TaxID=2666085 RepID=A0A7X2LSA8_9BURK|nr:HAMP domain-containing sensor histidine kinase [Pseudoduganella rivuli]MRV73320.1 sensor histidine kinase [Pseudoduganella rivuli]
MNIAKFILSHMEPILTEWEAFAATFGAAAEKMSTLELRDHAKQILEFVALEIEQAESPAQREAKSHGLGPHSDLADSASTIHGKLRFESGFTLLQLIAEYRALRASVLKLWGETNRSTTPDTVEQIMRFNEAIDQSIADAAVAYFDKVNETRDIFLAILGHDLRSPLAATSTAGSYLTRSGAFDERVQQIGVRIKRSAATMTAMVNDLLSLARTQLGDGIHIERRECDLLEMCQWAIEDASAAHPRANFDLRASGELMGLFDQARLQQLLTNLANNAAQYGAAGKPIMIEIEGQETRILLTVANQGAVIPEELLPTLFDSLVQLPEKKGDSRPASSLGLGLFIAKKIAVAHGGEISVVSNDVAGTVFTVEIPRQ